MRQNVFKLGMKQLTGTHNNNDIGNKIIHFTPSKREIKLNCEYLNLRWAVCEFIGLESFCVCVRPPGGHSLSRRCNPTPTAKPHPLLPLGSSRKSQTLTLTLCTSCGGCHRNVH